jgi:hypothetical protein
MSTKIRKFTRCELGRIGSLPARGETGLANAQEGFDDTIRALAKKMNALFTDQHSVKTSLAGHLLRKTYTMRSFLERLLEVNRRPNIPKAIGTSDGT